MQINRKGLLRARILNPRAPQAGDLYRQNMNSRMFVVTNTNPEVPEDKTHPAGHMWVECVSAGNLFYGKLLKPRQPRKWLRLFSNDGYSMGARRIELYTETRDITA
jgi:hypothetical protein